MNNCQLSFRLPLEGLGLADGVLGDIEKGID